MGRAGGGAWLLVLVAGFLLGCESVKPVAKPADSRTQSTHFLLSRHPNLALFFGEQEMAFEAFGKSADGREQIKIFTTDAYVAGLVAGKYFDVDEAIWPGPAPVQRHTRETSGGGKHTRITCPPTILTRATSDYLWSYPEIAEFAFELAQSPSGMISTAESGPTQNGDFQIVATKFGPLPGGGGIAFVGVPTIYLIATQHAREWGAAGTAVGLMRELAATIDDPNHRPSLRKILKSTAVVIVPVANPEGYEYTRTTARTWRGNRNVLSCARYGVDLNRNHEETWGVPAESIDLGPTCTRETFAGVGPASESETRAIRALIGGGGFEGNSAGVALIDYHTFSDIVVYPSGLKKKTDLLGPACEFLNNNCQTADFQALRELLGDTTSHRQSPPLFVDNWVSTPGTMFRRDQAPNVIYTSSGTLIDEAMYSTKRRTVLSATVELFDEYTGHNIECQAQRESILHDVVMGQMDVVERLASAANGLLASAPNNAWLPMRLGTIAPAVLTREYHSANSFPGAGPQHEDVRPTLLIPGWTQATGYSQLNVSVGGQSVPFDRLRRGVQYELFAANWAAAGGNPLCPPCEISTRVGDTDFGSSTVAPDCRSCIDLCDSSRVQGSSGWTLNKGVRGGADDCWWTPTVLPATLTIGPYSAPPGATHCTFSFSYRRTNYLGPLARNAFTVQRETPSGALELLWSEQAGRPYSTLAPQKLVTQIYEASELLPVGKIPTFVLSANDPSVFQGGVEVLDPVVYCRLGRLP